MGHNDHSRQATNFDYPSSKRSNHLLETYNLILKIHHDNQNHHQVDLIFDHADAKYLNLIDLATNHY